MWLHIIVLHLSALTSICVASSSNHLLRLNKTEKRVTDNITLKTLGGQHVVWILELWDETCDSTYRKVASTRLSWLVAHFHTIRLFMKGKFDGHVLWPFVQRVQNWIVDRSTARYFMVLETDDFFHKMKTFSNLKYPRWFDGKT